MNRVEIKNYAKEKLSGNLGSIWKILIIALGISLATGIVFGILFNNMDADILDIDIDLLCVYNIKYSILNIYLSVCINMMVRGGFASNESL